MFSRLSRLRLLSVFLTLVLAATTLGGSLFARTAAVHAQQPVPTDYILHGNSSGQVAGLAADINSSGQVVGWSTTASGPAHAFLWRASTGMKEDNDDTDIVRTTTGQVNLNPAGGSLVTIVAVTVPAGSWVLSATADAVNYGPSDYTRCAISSGNGPISRITTIVGNPALPGNFGPAGLVGALFTIAPVTSESSFVASLECWHDHSTPSNNPVPYIDPYAVLWAHQSSALE